MTYDVSFLWIWLVLAVLVGVAIGWREHALEPVEPQTGGWFRNAAIAWVLGLVAIFLQLLAGRLAFWLESAVLFYAAYVAGAYLGGFLRGARTSA